MIANKKWLLALFELTNERSLQFDSNGKRNNLFNQINTLQIVLKLIRNPNKHSTQTGVFYFIF
jgi:hypothetical protein